MAALTRPVVSVILPAYNAAAYIRDAIDSVLTQTFIDFELLIVDDGSTDSTREITRSYDDPRIRLIASDRNVGLTASLNHALAQARGEFVARQDADDVSEPDRLDVQLTFLRHRPHIALVGSWFTVIDTHGHPVRRVTLPTGDLGLRWAMWFSCPFVHSAMMWRRLPVQNSVGGYDERFVYAQDYELWIRVVAHFRAATVPAYLLRYREHESSMTWTAGAHTREGHCLRVAGVARTLGWTGSSDEQERRFRTLCALVRTSQATAMTADEARSATADLLTLHDATCQPGRDSPATARQHQRRVRAGISSALIGLSSEAAARHEFVDSMRLLAMACGVHWPTLVRRNTARTAARLVRSAMTIPHR